MHLVFVPGNCTSICQPADLGIIRLVKHEIKRQALQHAVNETVKQLQKGVEPETIRLDTIGHLRDATVSWTVAAWYAIN